MAHVHLGVNMPLAAARALAMRTHAGCEQGPTGSGFGWPWLAQLERDLAWLVPSHAATPVREQRGWSHWSAAACTLLLAAAAHASGSTGCPGCSSHSARMRGSI